MARKTNKTSHVLNLITNGASTESETKSSETAEEESPKEGAASETGKAQEPAAMQNHAGDRKVIVVDASDSEKISDEIRERLAEHIEQAVSESDGAAAEEAMPETGTSKETETFKETDSVKPEDAAPESSDVPAEGTSAVEEAIEALAGEAETAKADIMVESAEAGTAPETEKVPSGSTASEAAAPASGSACPEPEMEYHMVNVMEQVLGRANLTKQMEQYGVCTCSRCRADVLALSLTRLPSKYVVVDGNPVAPIIGFYESKYKARIITEVMKACILVKDRPRHKDYEITADILD